MLLSCCTLFLLLNSLKGQPQIQLLNEIYDFGKIGMGSEAIAVFRFVNTGDEDLQLTNVKSSCGCLVPYWEKDPIMPGDTGIVKGKYDSRRIGPINKSITIHSNAENKPVVVVRLKGQVVDKPTQVIWIPANQSDARLEVIRGEFGDSLFVDFGRVDFGELKEASFQFQVTGDYELCLFCRTSSRDGVYPVKLMADNTDDTYGLERNTEYFVEEYGGKFHLPALDPAGSDGRFDPGERGYLRIVLVNNVGDVPEYWQGKKLAVNLPGETVLIVTADMDLDHSRTPVFVKKRGDYSNKFEFRNGKCERRKNFRKDDEVLNMPVR